MANKVEKIYLVQEISRHLDERGVIQHSIRAFTDIEDARRDIAARAKPMTGVWNKASFFYILSS